MGPLRADTGIFSGDVVSGLDMEKWGQTVNSKFYIILER